MRKILLATVAAAACFGLGAIAHAAVELNTYADKDGYLDVQELSCAQLANTFQEDANYLTAMVQRLVQRSGEEAFRQYPPQQRGRARHDRLLQSASG